MKTFLAMASAGLAGLVGAFLTMQLVIFSLESEVSWRRMNAIAVQVGLGAGVFSAIATIPFVMGKKKESDPEQMLLEALKNPELSAGDSAILLKSVRVLTGAKTRDSQPHN